MHKNQKLFRNTINAIIKYIKLFYTKTKNNLEKTKQEKYINDKKEILKILKVNKEDRMRYFYADEITEENEKEIINLKNEIKRYFVVNTWMSFKTQ